MKISELLLEIVKHLSWNDLADKPTLFPPQEHNHTFSNITEDTSHRSVSDKEKQDWNNKVNKSTTHDITLLANGWTGDGAPFSQSVTVEGMDDKKNWEVTNRTNPMISLEQLNAFTEARVVSGSQSTNTINLVAFGKKPTIDIPLLVIVRED